MCWKDRLPDITQLRKLVKSVSGIFPVLKEPNETTAHVSRMLRLKLEHDVEAALKILRINLSSAPGLEKIGSGILVFGVGPASKQMHFFKKSDQMLKVTAKLGVSTATYCSLGPVIKEKPFDHVTKEALEDCLQTFVGHHEQQEPPFYRIPLSSSSDNQNGNEHTSVLERPKKSRNVVCFSAKCTEFKPPHFALDLHCGGIFSACTLVDQIGKGLESAACVTSLERTAMGPFHVTDCLPSYYLSWQKITDTIEKHRDQTEPLMAMLKARSRNIKKRMNREARLNEETIVFPSCGSEDESDYSSDDEYNKPKVR